MNFIELSQVLGIPLQSADAAKIHAFIDQNMRQAFVYGAHQGFAAARAEAVRVCEQTAHNLQSGEGFQQGTPDGQAATLTQSLLQQLGQSLAQMECTLEVDDAHSNEAEEGRKAQESKPETKSGLKIVVNK